MYGGLGVGELRRLKPIEEENREFEQPIVNLSLDKHMMARISSLRDVLRTIRVDNGPEFISEALDRRVCESGATLLLLPPDSLDLNLIEDHKAHLRKAAERIIHGLLNATGRILDLYRHRNAPIISPTSPTMQTIGTC